LFLETMMTASYAMVIPTVTEIEQKTLYSVLMIPGQRISIALAKYLAGFTATVLSAMQFTLSIGITVGLMALVFSLQVSNKIIPTSTVSSATDSAAPHLFPGMTELSATHHAAPLAAHQSAMIVFSDLGLFILALATSCAVLFVTSSWARSSGEGQLLVTLPSATMTFLPMASFLPALEFNKMALAVPLLNLFLLMKMDHVIPLEVAGVWLETFGLIAICIVVGDHLAMMRNGVAVSLPFQRTVEREVKHSWRSR
jgi:hypothetical protein